MTDEADGLQLKSGLAWAFGPESLSYLPETIDKMVLGGKGANLCSMAKAGVPVPPGFVISTELCKQHGTWAKFGSLMEDVQADFRYWYMKVSEHLGYAPLLSVRSGAPVSMPGMMDTILNVGINRTNLDEWVGRLGEKAALDCYRRFLEMYGDTVLHLPPQKTFGCTKKAQEIKYTLKTPPASPAEFTVKHFYKAIEMLEKNVEVLAIPDDSLATTYSLVHSCVLTVVQSWNTPRAKEYRSIHGIDDSMGTAVVIQVMVFGNLNESSGSGVLFSRDPATGHNEMVGEFLPQAQGEDVVAGVRTPIGIKEMLSMPSPWPGIYEQLKYQAHNLEQHFREMQDIEFTVQDGHLFLLQARTGKRAAKAAVKIAVDMVEHGWISKTEALSRLTPAAIKALTKKGVAPGFDRPAFAKGIPAGGGWVTGRLCTSTAAVETLGSKQPCILVAHETTPDDIKAINLSVGLLTATGGSTSHAAVVARGMEKTCVVGVTGLEISHDRIRMGDVEIQAGEMVTLCGDTGEVWAGEVPLAEPTVFPELQTMVDWAGGYSSVRFILDYAAGMDLGSFPYERMLLRVTKTADAEPAIAESAGRDIVVWYDPPAALSGDASAYLTSLGIGHPVGMEMSPSNFATWLAHTNKVPASTRVVVVDDGECLWDEATLISLQNEVCSLPENGLYTILSTAAKCS